MEKQKPTNAELIESLSEDLQPVRRWPGHAAYLLFCLAIAALVLAPPTLIGFREDIHGRLRNADYLFFLIAWAFAIPVAIWGAVQVSVPGRGLPRAWRILILAAAIVVMISTLFVALADEDFAGGLDRFGVKCALLTMAVTAAIAIVAYFYFSGGASRSTPLTGALIAFAAFGGGVLSIALHCPVDQFWHVAVWHALVPAIFGGTSAAWLLSKVLRW